MPATAKSRLIATVVVLWLAVLVLVAFVTINSPGERSEARDLTFEQKVDQGAARADCAAREAEWRRSQREASQDDPEPTGGRREVSDLFDLVPPTCILSYPNNVTHVDVRSYDLRSAGISLGLASLLGVVALAAIVIWTRQRDEPDDQEASLRRLAALHSDGILTDDEYEAKRRSVVEEL